MVWWVTKPSVRDFDDNKEARNRSYHQQLRRAPRRALIIKIADRLHNMVTLWTTSKAKQKRKVIETQDFYLPLCEELIVLIHEMEESLQVIITSWGSSTESV